MSNSRLSKEANNKVGEYQLNQRFSGYQARQDQTTITPDILVSPSRNVLVGTSGRVGTVKGYTLDGQSSATIDSGILSNYDFDNFKGDRRNMRAGFLTTGGSDGKLQFRYVNGDDTITWKDLKTGMTTVRLCFCDYWDNSALIKYVLWVDGSNNVFSWNGAVTTILSTTAVTVTKEGTNTWQQEGFTATGSININGTVFTYTGGYTTTTLTGLVAVPVVTVGTETHQEPRTTTLASMTAILSTFGPSIIGCGRLNQVYLGSSSSNNLYISKVNDYTNYTVTSPTRVVGEGAIIPLDSPPNKFIAQEVRNEDNAYDMYVSVGKNSWSVIRATLSSDLTKETLENIRLKTSPLQASMSERLCTKMKNQIMFIGNDNVAMFLGYTSDQFVPVIVDFSYPIINDMNSYDFTDGSIFYHRNYVYVAVPQHGITRIYNMTNQTQQQTQYSVESVDKQPWFWEAPIGYPLSGFYVVDGEIYGHSFTSSESYKIFNGGTFNGQDLDANATFAFDDKGDRSQSKGSNQIWVEGYIKQNTTITCTVTGDLDSFATSQTVTIDGSNSQYVALGSGAGALGKNPLGSQPLGGTDTLLTPEDLLPAWFHVVKTYPQVPFWLEQVSFTSKGTDYQWELITWGTNSRFTPEGNNFITD